MPYKVIFLLLFLFSMFYVKSQTSVLTEISNSTLDTLIELAKKNYPRIKYHNEQIAIARTNLLKTKKSWFDFFSLGYTRANNIGATSQNILLFNGYQYGVNVNLGTLIQKPMQIKGAKQEITSATHEKEEFVASIEAQVKERYYAYVKELTVLKLKMKTVQDSESIMFLMQTRFEKGEEKFDTYNAMISSYSSQVQEKMDTEINMLNAKARLEELIGVKIESFINTKNAPPNSNPNHP